MTFEVIDIVFALLVVIAAIRGAFRGFVTEVGSMAALILSFAAAIIFYKPVALILERQFGHSLWNPLIAFLILRSNKRKKSFRNSILLYDRLKLIVD